MEGKLLTLLADRPPWFTLWLQGLGIQTCSDLRNVWKSGAEMVKEAEETQGPMDADAAFNLAVVWTLALNQSLDTQQHIIRELVDERQSVARNRGGLVLREAPTTSIPAECSTSGGHGTHYAISTSCLS